MKRSFFLAGLFISLILFSLPFAASAADPPTINWTPVAQLKPLPSGPGVVVAEPIASDEKLADFGAGCARWLHLNVSSNVAFEKTAEWDALADVIKVSGRKNLQITPAQAKILFSKSLGATHVITGSIAENNGAISLKWQVWRLADLKMLGEVSADAPSEDAVVAALPQTGQKLVALLHGDEKYYADNFIAPTLNADELSFIGSLSWNMGYETSQQVANRLEGLSRKSLLANMFYLSYLNNINAQNFSNHSSGLWETALKILGSSVIKAPGNKVVKKNLLAVEEYAWWGFYSLSSMRNYRHEYVNLFSDYPHNYLSQMQEFFAFEDIPHWKNLETAVQLNSGAACAWYHLGDAYYYLAEHTRAGRPLPYINDAELYYLDKAYGQGVVAAQKSIELDSGNGYYWVGLAAPAAFDGQYELFEQAMDKAFQLSPDQTDAYDWAIKMYQPESMDNRQKFNDALNLLFQHPEPLAQCAGEAVEVSNEWDPKDTPALRMRIISTLEPYAKTHPQDIAVLADLAQICLDAGQNDKAKIAYEMLAKVLPDDSLCYRGLLTAAEGTKDWPAALQATILIAKTNTTDTHIGNIYDMRNATRVYFKNQKYKEAVASDLWLRKRNDSTIDEEMFAARSHLMLNDLLTAKVDLQYAVKAEEEDFKANRNTFPKEDTSAEDALPSSFYSLSALVDWKADKNIAEAQPLFDKALQKKDVSADTYADYAVFLAGQGQKITAQQSADKAQQMGYQDTTGMLKNAGL